MELNRFSLPDARHIASVAHGDVAVVAAEDDLRALGDDVTLAVDSCIDGGLGTAVAHGLDLLDHIRELHEPPGAGEEPGLEVGPQTKAEHRHGKIVDDGAELVDLLGDKELALVDEQRRLL